MGSNESPAQAGVGALIDQSDRTHARSSAVIRSEMQTYGY